MKINETYVRTHLEYRQYQEGFHLYLDGKEREGELRDGTIQNQQALIEKFK